MAISIVVNGNSYDLDVEPEMPLLWALRDTLELTGTKYSCGIGECGSCTVHVDGEAVQSCITTTGSVEGKVITTIEGLAEASSHPIQQAWIAENVSQCGYCQPGQIMSAAALLAHNPHPSPADIGSAMEGNLCRCGTYQRIRRAIERAATNGVAGDIEDPNLAAYLDLQRQAGELTLAGKEFGRYLPALLPLAGAIAFVKDGDNNRMGRRGFLQVAAAAGAGLIIGVSLPGCREPSEEVMPTIDYATGTPSPEQPPTATADFVDVTSPPSPAIPASPTSAGNETREAPAVQDPSVTTVPTQSPSPTPEPTAFFEPNLYLTIDNNGLATVIVHRVEMGQGARTALPMMVAEELEVEWSSVRVIQAPADTSYGNQQTAGSTCVYETFAPMRLAGAQAREMLITAAAQDWGVDKDTCYAENGTVVHEPTGRIQLYGELVETASALPPSRGQMKDPADFKIIGTRIGHYDNPQIVNGSMTFGIDVTVPGLLYAAVARSPELRGEIVDFDGTAIERIPGVRHVVPISSGVAVVADNSWAAQQGRKELDITWQPSRYTDLNSDDLAREYRERVTPGTTEANFLEAVYQVSFLAHATPSPMNCTADIRNGRGEVWAPTQTPQYAKSTAVRVAGLSSEDLTLHVPRLGGGFGRRLQVDYVRDAVEISREIGMPVKVMYSREDDIRHDYYHPLSVHYASADLTRRHLPQIRSQTYGEWDRITGAWRAVSNFTDGFVRECFVDEIAEYLDEDPLELRIELLPGSFRPVLEAAADMAGWGTPLPENRSRGVAAYATWGVTNVVMIAEVSLESGGLRVHRIVTAIDCGTVINPDLVEAQMEGGIAWGLSALLGSEITIVDGQVQQSNYHDYPILRFSQMPVVDVHIMSSILSPNGVGEMGVPPVAPAVLNALYGLTGQRLRTLPIRPEDIRDV